MVISVDPSLYLADLLPTNGFSTLIKVYDLANDLLSASKLLFGSLFKTATK